MTGHTFLQKTETQKKEKTNDLFQTRELDSNKSPFMKIPDLWLEKTFTLPIQFPINNAIKLLGFTPSTSFEQGMKNIKNWLFDYNSKPELASCETIFIPKNSIPISLKQQKK